jgi:hypothetical protein
MRVVFFLLGCFLSITEVVGQREENRLCGHEHLINQIRQSTQEHKRWVQNRQFFEEAINQAEYSLPNRVQQLVRIPVVVHVMHLPTESYGVLSNITDEQIRSQIEVLNEDFRRLAGSRGDNNNPVGADTEIEFCLATRDPAGQPTNGIVRVPYNGSNNFQLANDMAMKDLSRWPTSRYLNIWVVKSIQSGILGYAYLPEMLAGDPDRSRIDGVVAGARFFGSRDKQPAGQNFYLSNDFGLGRTVTHEVGHYLNLLHTWGDGGCEVDDLVDDTPLCSGQYFGCPPSPPRPTQCGFGRMVENYMDYSDDACFNIFTQGQRNRMRTALGFYAFRASLITPANIMATGCADSLTVFFADSMFIVSGNRQTVRVNRLLDADLNVRVINQNGGGFNNKEVRFELVEQPWRGTEIIDTVVQSFQGGFASIKPRASQLPGTYVVRASANTVRGGEVYFTYRVIAEAVTFPNPFADEIVLKLDYPELRDVIIAVRNLHGQEVLRYGTKVQEAHLLDMRGYPDGFYLVTVQGGPVNDYFKIIKIKP